MEEMGTQKISICDQRNGFQDKSHKSDSFVLDIESFSNGTDKDITANSRITRSLSRKVSLRGGERKTNSTSITATERDAIAVISASDASPKGFVVGGNIMSLCNSRTWEKPVSIPLVIGTTEPFSPQGQHITITAANIAGRRYSGSGSGSGGGGSRRSAPCWAMDPRRILFFFATLSSMGTIILIYFTLSISKFNGEDNAHAQYR